MEKFASRPAPTNKSDTKKMFWSHQQSDAKNPKANGIISTLMPPTENK